MCARVLREICPKYKAYEINEYETYETVDSLGCVCVGSRWVISNLVLINLIKFIGFQNPPLLRYEREVSRVSIGCHFYDKRVDQLHRYLQFDHRAASTIPFLELFINLN